MNKKEDILFELIMTKQCNIRCDYCPVQFENKIMNQATLDSIAFFISQNRSNTRNFYINFFGGEPLLEFNNIKYFIGKTKQLKLQYSIGTNGILLTRKKLNYFIDNKVEIYLTIDHNSEQKIKKLIPVFAGSDLSGITVNLVVSPNHINKYLKFFHKIHGLGIKKFTFLAICASALDWNKKALNELKQLVNKLNIFYHRCQNTEKKFDLYRCTFEKTSKSVKEYVISWDGKVHADDKSILWLFKQAKNINPALKELIEKKSFINDIKNLKFKNLKAKYDEQLLRDLVLRLTKDIKTAGKIKKITQATKPLNDFK